jgi:hypothetical protein
MLSASGRKDRLRAFAKRMPRGNGSHYFITLHTSFEQLTDEVLTPSLWCSPGQNLASDMHRPERQLKLATLTIYVALVWSSQTRAKAGCL